MRYPAILGRTRCSTCRANSFLRADLDANGCIHNPPSGNTFDCASAPWAMGLLFSGAWLATIPANRPPLAIQSRVLLVTSTRHSAPVEAPLFLALATHTSNSAPRCSASVEASLHLVLATYTSNSAPRYSASVDASLLLALATHTSNSAPEPLAYKSSARQYVCSLPVGKKGGVARWIPSVATRRRCDAS